MPRAGRNASAKLIVQVPAKGKRARAIFAEVSSVHTEEELGGLRIQLVISTRLKDA